jgi:hypothetical protein
MEKENQTNPEHHKPVLHFTINGEKFEWESQYIIGAEIKKLGKIPKEDELFLSIKKPWEDELITDESRVDLARPEVEHFISRPKSFLIIVNGTKKQWDKPIINFAEVIILAFGRYDESQNLIYTVGYEDGPMENPQGTMSKGNEVSIKNKMIFHATAANKS